MRSILRRAAVLTSVVCLAFFWSCERHHPSELPNHDDHAPGGDHGDGAKDEHSHGGKDDHAHGGKDDHAHPHAQPSAGQPGAAQHAHPHGAPNPGAAPIGTPAEFFPAASPSPSPQ